MKQFIRNILGIDQLEETIAAQSRHIEETTALLADVKRERDALATEAKAIPLTPKEIATAEKEPYVTVTKTHVDPENVSNGFFELDWNEYFVSMLRNNGYTGVTEEEVVDKWFSDVCKNVGEETGVDMTNRGRGYVNINRLDNGRSEIG